MLKKYVSKQTNKRFALKSLTIAAFMGYSFGGQMVQADNLTWSLDPTLDDGLYTTSAGSAQNHSFAVKTADKSGNVSTSYYNITLNPAKFSTQSNITYAEVIPEFDADGNITTPNVIKISLPNNETKYYQYTLQNNKTYSTTYENLYEEKTVTETSRTRNSVLNGGVAINNPAGMTISIEDTLFQNNTSNLTVNYYNTSYPLMNGGAIYNNGTITNLNADFYGNTLDNSSHLIPMSCTYPGCSPYTEANGGAIFNEGTIGNITGDFVENEIADGQKERVDYAHGGAIANYAYVKTEAKEATIGDITGNFIGNKISGGTVNGATYGGAIANAAITKSDSTTAIANIGNITGDFINNYSPEHGGAIGNYIYAYYTSTAEANIGDITGNFIGNHADESGGAIYQYTKVFWNAVSGKATIGNIVGNYIGNYVGDGHSTSAGGAISNSSGGSISGISGDFIGNYAYGPYNVSGGAISNGGNIETISGNFIGNYTKGTGPVDSYRRSNYGGAISNGGTISNLNANFVGNYVENTRAGFGGAIHNSSYNSTMKITGNFVENYVQGETANGGAIHNEGKIDSIDATFSGNKVKATATNTIYYDVINILDNNNNIIRTLYTASIPNDNGYNVYLTEEQIKSGDYVFEQGQTQSYNESTILGMGYSSVDQYFRSRNPIDENPSIYSGNVRPSAKGTAQGGAISNTGTIESISGTFVANEARGGHGDGGAIYNTGTIKDINADFIGNSTYSGAKENNDHTTYHYYSDGCGGAIYNSGQIESLSGTFEGNHYEAPYVEANGGAVYNVGNIGAVKPEEYSYDIIHITDSDGNILKTAYQVYGLNDSEIKSGYYVFELNNERSVVLNLNNYSDADDYIAGYNLITYNPTDYNGGESYISGIENAEFNNNYTKSVEGNAYGGAIANLPVRNSIDDGEIYITGGNIKLMSNVSFSGNHIQTKNGEAGGGALYNIGTIEELNNSTFVNNYATSTNGKAYGGAIYNRSDNPVSAMLANYGYSSIEEMAQDRGYTSAEDMIDGYSSLEEMAKAWGYPSGEALVNSYGASSVEELLDNWGYSSIEEWLESENRYNHEKYDSVEDMAIAKGFGFAKGEITFTGENTLYNNKANGKLNDIYNTGKITLAQDATVTSNSGIDGEEGVVYLEPNSTLNVNHYLKGQKVNIDNATINIGAVKQADNSITYGSVDLSALTVTANGGMFNAVNNHIAKHNFGDVTLNGNLNMSADVDLAKEKMDSVKGKSYSGTGNINVVGMNLLSDTTKKEVSILFANKVLKDHVTSDVKEVGKGVNNKYQKTAFAPIYKYDVKYENRNNAGYFVFSGPGGGSDEPVVPISTHFNPAVLAGPVATQAGASATMNQALSFAFEHGETFMNNSSMDRFAMTHDNVYALSTDFDENLGRIDYSHENKSVWVKPYSVFENIKLKNGPKVDTISYGTLIGFDSNIHRLKKGWYNVGTAYIGYNGSQMDYKGVDASTNGGLLGVTETFYKGNFWTALTATAGAAGAEARTMYGKDDMTMLMAGIGSKTGYNFEFADGKFIIQPRMFVAYSMVKTFDYTNAAGVRIDSDPVHTIQVNPAIKFIGNTKNGWQPYASVGMMWNLLNEVHATADGVKLPEMQTKPYVEYGVGVQKLWNEKYSAYAQAMVRNGGKNGIALTFGFRMALGKEGKPIEKVENTTFPKEASFINTSKTSMNGIIK